MASLPISIILRRYTLALTLVPMIAFAEAEKLDSNDPDECQRITALLGECLNNHNAADPNCHIVQTPEGRHTATNFLEECRANSKNKT